LAALDDLEAFLKTARALAIVPNPKPGANQSFLVGLEGGVAVVAKYDGPHVNVNQELAAWRLARLLEWTDLVAATVRADFQPTPGQPMQSAVLQVAWAPREVGTDPANFPDDKIWRAGIFDAIVLHGDRHPGNWLGSPPPEPGIQSHLRLIDHGIGWGTGGAPNSPFYLARRDQPIPAELAGRGQVARDHLADADLEALLGKAVSDGIEARMTLLIDRGHLNVE